MTRWTCPTCGMWITTHITLKQPPTCAHGGTRHDAKRPNDMITEEKDT